MLNVATTTTLLLEGLADPGNEAAWREFDSRYRPIIEAFARKLGLNEDDAADVAQEALLRFIKSYRDGKYDRSRGRLRSWIIGIVKFRVADLKATRAEQAGRRGESVLLQLPSDDQLEEYWEQEHRRDLLRHAMNELRASSRTSEKSFSAFTMLMNEQLSPGVVAERLGLTLHDVYMVKRRMIDRLREILAKLTTIYAEG